MKNLPLRYLISITLIGLVLVSSVLIWLINYFSSHKNLEELATVVHSQALKTVHSQLDVFMGQPQRANNRNLKNIQAGILDYKNPESIGKQLFVDFQSLGSVISMEYGDEQRNDTGPAKGLFDVALSFGLTDDNHIYRLYEVDERGNKGRILYEEPNYDPREKSWYKEAVKAGRATWTPIYLWPNGDVGLDAVMPVFIDGRLIGVFDAAITTKGIGEFLKEIKFSDGTQIHILERNGLLVASSALDNPNLNLNGKLERLSATSSGILDLVSVLEYFAEEGTSLTDLEETRHLIVPNSIKRFVSITPYKDEFGLNWLVVVTTPELDIMSNLFLNSRRSQAIIFLSVIISILTAIFLARSITRPISKLSGYAAALAAGNWEQNIDIYRSDEVGQLASAFREMTKQLKSKTNSLEEYTQAVVSERQKLEAILRSMADPVCVVDNQKKIILVNPSFRTTFGVSEKDILGLNIGRIHKLLKINLADREKISEMIDMLYGESSGIVDVTSLEMTTGTGRIVVVDGVGSRLRDSRGNIAGLVIVFRDITKRAELDKLRSDFVSLASHQLNTPLTGIKWTISGLLESDFKFPPRIRESLETIAISNQKLIQLVGEILRTSKAETGKIDISRQESVLIRDLIKGGFEEVKTIYEKKGMKIEGISTLNSKLKVMVDKFQLIQVFMNLFQNASTYSKPRKTVTVRLIASKKTATISISDQGYGIPDDEQNKIFEKFFRASNISSTIPGTGLGLYFVKHAVENHGGRVWLESELGKGTTFFIELPLDKS